MPFCFSVVPWRRRQSEQTTKWNSISLFWRLVQRDKTNKRRNEILFNFDIQETILTQGGLCPWPTFHTWVTMVRKKWLSLYCNTYGCYIYQSCTNCSSWHDLPMSFDDLCPWPTFHAWVTMVRKKWLVYITVHIGATFAKLTPTVHLDIIHWYHMLVCVRYPHFTLEWQWLGRNG